MTTLEVCVGGAEDAMLAAQAGAHRVELNQALEVGGLTPSAAVIAQTLARVSVPVVVMIRPRPGGFAYSDGEWRVMLSDADAVLAAGAHGIVCGGLRGDGTLDAARMRELVDLADGREVVAHRAFDATPDLDESLRQLADIGVARVLTTGGARSAPAGVDRLRGLIDLGTGVDVMPGGGVTEDNAADIVAATGCRSIHGSFSREVGGTGPYGTHRRLDPARLRRALDALA